MCCRKHEMKWSAGDDEDSSIVAVNWRQYLSSQITIIKTSKTCWNIIFARARKLSLGRQKVWPFDMKHVSILSLLIDNVIFYAKLLLLTCCFCISINCRLQSSCPARSWFGNFHNFLPKIIIKLSFKWTTQKKLREDLRSLHDRSNFKRWIKLDCITIIIINSQWYTQTIEWTSREV